MNVIQDINELEADCVSDMRATARRVRAYVYLVTLAFLVCLVGWVAS